MSAENVVAESWEDADADPVKEIMEKIEKVKLLQRKEEKKEAFFEKVKAEENGVIPKLQAEEGTAQTVEEPKRVFLRRPKDGFASETVADTSPTPATASQSNSGSRGRSHHKHHHKEPKQTQTLEERQAAYQAARDRILGSEYKPDNGEIKEIKFIDRSKSPETLRMTEQNMVEHYGEELSRELMHQPVELVPVSQHEPQFIPDFSLPPPSFSHHNDTELHNGPQGFQHQQNFQPQHPSQRFVDTPYYQQMNGQMPMVYPNQQAFQHFIQQEQHSSMSSSSQNSMMEGQREQQQQPPVFYNYPPQQQQQMSRNFVPFNLPDMSYPPPNFHPQGQHGQHVQQHQKNPQMIAQMNQMMQAPQASHNQMIPQYQMQNAPTRIQNPVRGGAVPNNGAGRGQNRPSMTYNLPIGVPLNQPPMPLMQQHPNVQQQQKNAQSFMGRNGGHGQQQQPRQFQQNQQNGQLHSNQNVNQSNQNNGRKQMNRRQNDEVSMQHIQQVAPVNMNVGQNPIPFGCPPRHVNEHYAKASNSQAGAGLLGAYPPLMGAWTAPPSTRPQ